jgi:hypothetical protein
MIRDLRRTPVQVFRSQNAFVISGWRLPRLLLRPENRLCLLLVNVPAMPQP